MVRCVEWEEISMRAAPLPLGMWRTLIERHQSQEVRHLFLAICHPLVPSSLVLWCLTSCFGWVVIHFSSHMATISLRWLVLFLGNGSFSLHKRKYTSPLLANGSFDIACCCCTIVIILFWSNQALGSRRYIVQVCGCSLSCAQICEVMLFWLLVFQLLMQIWSLKLVCFLDHFVFPLHMQLNICMLILLNYMLSRFHV